MDEETEEAEEHQDEEKTEEIVAPDEQPKDEPPTQQEEQHENSVPVETVDVPTSEENEASTHEVVPVEVKDTTSDVVRAMQKLVTLPNMENASWQDITPLQHYADEPSEETLCVAMVGEHLVACQGPHLPAGAQANSPRFIMVRQKDEVLTADRLCKQVASLSMPGAIVPVIHTILEKGFAEPFVYKNTRWPLSKKTRLCSLLHALFEELGRSHYGSRGLTYLYIPTEGLDTVDSGSTEDETITIGRLEEAVSRWHEQVSTAVNADTLSSNFPLVSDLVTFWNTKYENMCFLDTQLKSEAVQFVLQLLEKSQSHAAALLSSIVKLAEGGKVEAESNHRILKSLSTPSTDVSSCTDLKTELPSRALVLINAGRIVWLHAPNFNSRSRVTQLFSCLSHQIVDVCSKNVNLRRIFKGRPVYGLERISLCITATQDYMKLYEKVADMHRKHTEISWDISSQEIFNSIYIFINRCKDLKEICETMMIFGRQNEQKPVCEALFSGPRGRHFGATCDVITKDTLREVELLAQRRHQLFDVTSTEWQPAMDRFRQQIKQVERRVKALCHAVMERASNVDEAVQAMHSLHHYLQKPSLYDIREEKSNLVYELMMERIEVVSRSVLGGSIVGYTGTPTYAGAALMARHYKTHLERQMKLITASEFLSETCSRREKVIQECSFIAGVLHETELEFYERWVAMLPGDWEANLRRSLLSSSSTPPGAIEVTISSDVLETFAEAHLWQVLGFVPPGVVRELCEREAHITDLLENMKAVCNIYNKTLSSLSDAERCLFKNLILRVDKTLRPAFRNYSWTTNVPPEFLKKCLKHVEEFKTVAQHFHKNCKLILEECTKIEKSNLVSIKNETLYQTNELRTNLRKAIKPPYEAILKLLGDIKNKFKANSTQESDLHWINFVTKISNIAEESVVKLVQKELTNILVMLTENTQILIHIKMSVHGNQVFFNPTVESVLGTVTRTLEHIALFAQAVPNLVELLQLTMGKKLTSLRLQITKNVICKELQAQLNEVIEETRDRIQEYSDSWENLSWMWSMDKEKFVSGYEQRYPGATEISQDIDRISMLFEEITISTDFSIRFVHIDASAIKNTISSHIDTWRKSLLELMRQSTLTKAQNFHAELDSEIIKLQREPVTLQDVAEKTICCQFAMAHTSASEIKLRDIKEHWNKLVHYQVLIPENLQQLLEKSQSRWNEYLETLTIAKNSLEISKESFRMSLLENGNALTRELTQISSELKKNGPFETTWNESDAFEFLENNKTSVNDIKLKREEVSRDFDLFGIEPPKLAEMENVEMILDILNSVWEVRRDWSICWEKYKKCKFTNLQATELQNKVKLLAKKLSRLVRGPARDWPVLEQTRNDVEDLRHALPLILILRNPAMRARHWEQVQQEMKRYFNHMSDDFTLKEALTLNVTKFDQEIRVISKNATSECEIEMGLEGISTTWDAVKLEFEEQLPQRKMQNIKPVDEILSLIDRHLNELTTMEASRFLVPFKEDVIIWKNKLYCVLDTLVLINTMQDTLLQIEPLLLDDVYQAEISSSLPKKVFKNWNTMLDDHKTDQNFIQIVSSDGYYDNIKIMSNKVEEVYTEILSFLEKKREACPRLHFLSTSEQLRMFQQAGDLKKVQELVSKCFPGVTKLRLGRRPCEFLGFCSASDEVLNLAEPEILQGSIIEKIAALEKSMKTVMSVQIARAHDALVKNPTKREKWLKTFPLQICLLATKIFWTTACSEALEECENLNRRKPIRVLKQDLVVHVTKLCETIKRNVSNSERMKTAALLISGVQELTIIDKVHDNGCKKIVSYDWLSQLRFYRNSDGTKIEVRQMFGTFEHGLEFYGAPHQIFVTPDTERCVLQITSLLHLQMAGLLQGPPGCGKTLILRALVGTLGRLLFEVNCTEALNYIGIGKIIAGATRLGAWCVLRGFLNLDPRVLSVVALNLRQILSPSHIEIKNSEERSLNSNSAVFVTLTMNKHQNDDMSSDLPACLRPLLRPVNMQQPDNKLVVEMALLTEGISDPAKFAIKLCRLFELCRLHLSPQPHYNFSTRKLVYVAQQAGANKRLSPKSQDDELILQSVTSEIGPQLVVEDRNIFLEFTTDLFPGVEMTPDSDVTLVSALKKSLTSAGLMPLDWSIIKSIQLFRALQTRGGVILVGRSGSGKTTAWKTLSKALRGISTDQDLNVYPVYPNSLSYKELFGEFNETTDEHKNGLIINRILNICEDESKTMHWILLDGEIEDRWSQDLLGIFDESKIITSGSGERINISEKLKIIFEVESLATVTPAFLSHCSCVHFEIEELGYQPYLDTWTQKVKNKDLRSELTVLMKDYVSTSLQFKHDNCTKLFPQSKLSCVQTLCRFLDTFLINKEKNQDEKEEESSILTYHWFFFCLVWSIFGAISIKDRSKVDVFVRNLKVGLFPPDDLVFDYCIDLRSNKFVKWMKKFPVQSYTNNLTDTTRISFHKLMMPGVDITRYTFLTSALLKSGHPIMLTGHSGAGKSFVAMKVFENLDKEKFSTLVINGTAQRDRKSFTKMIERKLERRCGDLSVPKKDKRLVTLIEDVGVMSQEVKGHRPVHETLRQLMEHGSWVDYEGKYVSAKDVQLLTTFQHSDPGDLRLWRHFSVLEIGAPCREELQTIFQNALSKHLLCFGEHIKLLGKNLVTATLDIYENVKKVFLPIPTKCHYIFNLRNLSEVMQGLLLSNEDHHYTKKSMCKLWFHENYRVYSDRIVDTKDQEWLLEELYDQLKKHFNLSKEDVICSDKNLPLFGFESDEDYVETSCALVQSKFENELQSVGSHSIMFREAAEHVLRVARILQRNSSHLLLLGTAGCGRHSVLKLACHLRNLKLVYADVGYTDLNAEKSSKFHSQVSDLLKQAALGQRIVLLVSEVQMCLESDLDVLNNIILPGYVQQFLDEKQIEQLDAELNFSSKEKIFDTDVTSFIIEEKIQQNFHVVICINPDNPTFREHLIRFPGLAACAMNFFDDWSEEALLQVAKKYLTKLKLSDEEGIQQKKELTIASIFSKIHLSVLKIAENTKISITPAHYLDCLKTYSTLVCNQQSELYEKTSKFKQGLQKIEETKQKVEKMAEELLKAQRQVVERQRVCESALVTLGQRRREVEEQSAALETSSKQLEREEAAARQLARLAHAAMDEASPCVDDADMALDSLQHKDLLEMRAYGRPPDAVEIAMSAVLILKQADPTWVEAKRQLTDETFIEQLENFDKDHIPDKTLKSISSLTSNPEFNTEKIGTVSVPAKLLAQWVLAVEKYARIYRVAAPKRAKSDRASRELRERQIEHTDLQTRLSSSRLQLEEQKQEYEKSLETKDILIAQAEEMGARLQRANQLVSGLTDEETTWRKHVEDDTCFQELILGDCLIVSTVLSYSGPFTASLRDGLQQETLKLAKEAGLKYSEDLKIANYLVNTATLIEWSLIGLPRDNFSSTSAVIALQNILVPSNTPSPICRWPLLVDPQGLAIKWLSESHVFRNLQISDQRKHNFIEIVEECLQDGHTLVIDDMEDDLKPILRPLLIKNLIKDDKQPRILFNDKEIPYNTQFKLILRTLSNSPNVTSELASRINEVNFNIQETGLREALLDITISKERSKLEEERKQLSEEIFMGHRTLKHLEQDVLWILCETHDSLLDQLDVMENLEQNKIMTLSSRRELHDRQNALQDLETSRESHLPCARRAVILFFTLMTLSKMDPMYKFSLHKYFEQFSNSIEMSAKSKILSERLANINNNHTLNFYQSTCLALREQHRLPFSFYLCSKLMENEISEKHINFLTNFLSTSGNIENSNNSCFAWLPGYCWQNVSQLEEFDDIFHEIKQNLIDYQEDWSHWYSNPHPEDSPLIGSYASLEGVNRMLLIISLRPDRLTSCVHKFIKSQTWHVEPGERELTSFLVNSQTTVILPGSEVDLTWGLQQIVAPRKLNLMCMGQGQKQRVIGSLKEAAENGDCILVNDCHLETEWLYELQHVHQEFFEQLSINPNFKCWMSAKSYEKFPLAILQHATKISIEKTRDFQLTLKRLLIETKGLQNQHQLFSKLAVLHATFLQRQQFDALGWAQYYQFSDSDFLVCCKFVVASPEDYEDWLLKLVELGYSGRVSQPSDQMLLQTLVQEVFSSQQRRVSNIRTDESERNGSGLLTPTSPSNLTTDTFGMSQNAITARDKIKTVKFQQDLKLMKETFYKRQYKIIFNRETLEKVQQICQNILEIIPNKQFLTSLKIEKPIEIVLVAEILQYNSLTMKIKKEIKKLQTALKGFTTLTKELFILYSYLVMNSVPPDWKKNDSSSSDGSLANWAQNLSRKIFLLQEWASEFHPPSPINLAIFNEPAAFLSALLQINVSHLADMERMTWVFTISKPNEEIENPIDLKQGCVLRGLKLNGAAWDSENGHIIESAFASTPRVDTIMPDILLTTSEFPSIQIEEVYMCPCYTDSSRSHYLFSVPLNPGNLSSEHWLIRGVSLSLNL